MSEVSYEVWLIGVEPSEPDPAQAIASAFHIDRVHADALLDSLPCCVKRTSVEVEARSIAAGLAIAGGHVEVRDIGAPPGSAGEPASVEAGRAPGPRSLPPLPTLDTEPGLELEPSLPAPPSIVVGVYDPVVHDPRFPTVRESAATLGKLVARRVNERGTRLKLALHDWAEARLAVPVGSRRARVLAFLERHAETPIRPRIEIAAWLALSVALLVLGLAIRRSFLLGLETDTGRIRDTLALFAACKAIERGVIAVRENPRP